MSDFIRCLVGMFAVIAPLGALATLLADRAAADATSRRLVASPVAALAVLAVSAGLSGPLLNWLNISPESFQFAAGVAMLPVALRLIVMGDSMPAPERATGYGWLIPFAVPMLAGPSSIIASISYAARFGEGEAIAGSAIVLAMTAAIFVSLQRLERVPLVVVLTAARLSGGLLILIAVELAVDGVRSV